MKTILVIGGSSGIGKAIVQNHLNTHQVIVFSRNAPDFTAKNLTHYTVDVVNDNFPELPTMDQLVYCPGSIQLKPFKSLSLDQFKEDMQINLYGAIRAIQQYLPQLNASNQASVLLFSTVATRMGMPFHASVAACKSAIEGLVKSLAAEYATKIRFNAIAPTVTDTPLAARFLKNQKSQENIQERHPLKRYLHANEVAHLATYLLSPQSASISGQIFQMDCGITTLKL